MIGLIGIILYVVLIALAIKYVNKLLDMINKEIEEKIIKDLEQLDKDIKVIKKHFDEVDLDLPYDDVLKQCDEPEKDMEE